MDIQLFPGELDLLPSSRTDDELSRDDWHQHCINSLVHVLNQNGGACLDRDLDFLIRALAPDPHSLQVACLLFRLDPLDTLELRVDHQRVSFTIRQDCTVLD